MLALRALRCVRFCTTRVLQCLSKLAVGTRDVSTSLPYHDIKRALMIRTEGGLDSASASFLLCELDARSQRTRRYPFAPVPKLNIIISRSVNWKSDEVSNDALLGSSSTLIQSGNRIKSTA